MKLNYCSLLITLSYFNTIFIRLEIYFNMLPSNVLFVLYIVTTILCKQVNIDIGVRASSWI